MGPAVDMSAILPPRGPLGDPSLVAAAEMLPWGVASKDLPVASPAASSHLEASAVSLLHEE